MRSHRRGLFLQGADSLMLGLRRLGFLLMVMGKVGLQLGLSMKSCFTELGLLLDLSVKSSLRIGLP